ncbi:GlxA family transcriptional regulator [Jannaschia formosa]|uniref:GlxA family transcriptional regulator n=1 Tax=Jannaschia formosa TaxID=2259592 RepID=UPI000E1BDB25|nr:helix-turn-helix domain-containing protein [Jannaschia formosa]TFL16331.1 helix-turn-helix domain-containing protein [Jannaschia formosa]
MEGDMSKVPSETGAAEMAAQSAADPRPTRRVGFLVYDGMAASEIVWQVDMFRQAPRAAALEGMSCPNFEVLLLGLQPGPVMTWSDFPMMAEHAFSDVLDRLDMLFVPGAPPDRMAHFETTPEYHRFIACAAAGGCRIVAVTTAAILIGQIGLLKGRRATTHSAYADLFRSRLPDVDFDPDPLWVEDGPIVTVSGAMPAAEFALEVIEREAGRALSFALAKAALMPIRRGGSQSRLSAALVMQMEATDRFDGMLQWLTENLHVQVTVADLADLAGMSPRNFARRFVERTGTTPARFVETLRAERARQLVETTALPLMRVAERSGLRDEQSMRRAFLKAFGQTPSGIRDAAKGEA